MEEFGKLEMDEMDWNKLLTLIGSAKYVSKHARSINRAVMK